MRFDKRPQLAGHVDCPVISPGCRPDAWYGSTLAHDAVGCDGPHRTAGVSLRQRLLGAGWAVRVGSGNELVTGGGDCVKASA